MHSIFNTDVRLIVKSQILKECNLVVRLLSLIVQNVEKLLDENEKGCNKLFVSFAQNISQNLLLYFKMYYLSWLSSWLKFGFLFILSLEYKAKWYDKYQNNELMPTSKMHLLQ